MPRTRARVRVRVRSATLRRHSFVLVWPGLDRWTSVPATRNDSLCIGDRGLTFAVAAQVGDGALGRAGNVPGNITGHVHGVLRFLSELVGRAGDVVDPGVGETLGGKHAAQRAQDACGRRMLGQTVDEEPGPGADKERATGWRPAAAKRIL